MSGSKIGDCSDPNCDCFKAEKLVDLYVDNALETQDRVFIDKHLDGCVDCKDGFSFESTFKERIHSLSPIAMPVEVKEHILLSLGFPGLSDSSFAINTGNSSSTASPAGNMGIPKGEIPRGEIPSSDFFDDGGDSPK